MSSIYYKMFYKNYFMQIKNNVGPGKSPVPATETPGACRGFLKGKVV